MAQVTKTVYEDRITDLLDFPGGGYGDELRAVADMEDTVDATVERIRKILAGQSFAATEDQRAMLTARIGRLISGGFLTPERFGFLLTN